MTRRAFTLIELLVVIAIIAVLIGLAFPAFQGVQNSARRTQAKNDVVQIVSAVTAFYTEYGRYPVPAGTSSDGYSVGAGGASSKELLDPLRGLDPTLNPKQVQFINPPDARDQSHPKNGIKTADGQFYDPWETPYGITIDADYDNLVPNPYNPNSGAGAARVRQGVIGWSKGKDGKLGRNDNRNFSGSDDVISWQ